jgi:RsiW-degrading membrane proteinase PrsW (M82 family)
MFLDYIFSIFIGILPALIWLAFFLRKDVHPEPPSKVLEIFLLGMLVTIPTFILEKGGWIIFSKFLIINLFLDLFYLFFAAFVEEIMKFLVVKENVLKSSELDEPTDVILYMIISALGFAAAENIFQILKIKTLKLALILAIFRFWGAIFLHALVSGFIGYFLALSFYEKKNKKILPLAFLGATTLHWIFNFLIIQIGEAKNLLFFGFLIWAILLSLAVFISKGFQRLQKLKGVCKI